MTRDIARYKTYFPTLALISPEVTVTEVMSAAAATNNCLAKIKLSFAASDLCATNDLELEKTELLKNGTDVAATGTVVTGTALSWTGATLSGTSSIKIEVRDAAGNVGTVATQNYELDTTAPTQTVSAIDISADTGSSATDFITATASQTITGTLSANLGTGESLWGSVDGGANYVDVSSSVTGTAISWAGATLSGSSSIKFQVKQVCI
jgi:hypothetical protein